MMRWLAAGVLGGAVGCQHQAATLPQPGPSQPLAANNLPIDPKLIRKEPERPKRPASPQLLVRFADFKAGEAFAPNLGPSQQQTLREQARKSYQQAILTDPKYLPAYKGLARLYTAVQDHARALETYQKALEVAPRNADLWYELGICHNFQKEWEPALDCLNRAVQFDPENRDFVNTLGVVLARTGHYPEALDCFGRVSGEALAHYKLARTLQHLQQPELSRHHLEAALQKDPNLASAQAMMGELNEQMNRPIQRTGYQEPPAPPAPETPPSRPVQPAVYETGTPASAAPAAEGPIALPPPPVLNLKYDAPSEPAP